ncbi:C2 calcium-dependent domain-containing protein 4A [Rousettus aegyptiacus]|uniref:C2 calcium dependent domain containing 4A n=1 Tax=Rousettus aegyptiacus TaxID=9407 RepID=A0A7J8IFF2_ROUAE|nr:C2 calcium-dependent domain-containing protein 4A [Rousettus aegyptiacus]KAF6483337.1 C2 calcium dependent domain containing 4A [Rousettus aegyptiacus]
MWWLERLYLGPKRLLRGVNRRLQCRTRRTTATTPVACANVLTPDRIPEFCIPPRLAPCPALATLRDFWDKEAVTDDGAGRTDSDPRSQAALSLPHLPRALTAYGFCALLESPHTRRKESLFLGSPGAAALLQPPAAQRAPRPRAHTYGGGGGGSAPEPLGGAPAAASTVPGGLWPPRNTLASRPPGSRLLRAPEGLLSRALRARRSRGLARARSLSSGDEDEERGAGLGSPARAPSASPQAPPSPRPDRLEAEGTVTLDRAGGALRLAVEYSRASGRLRIRLLRPEGQAGGDAEPRAVGCRVSFVLQPPGKTRQQRGAVVRRSRKAVFDQDFWFDGLSEDEVRRLAVRVKAENKGRGLERGRLLGQGELLLGSLLLL